jgi:hypothetical protein
MRAADARHAAAARAGPQARESGEQLAKTEQLNQELRYANKKMAAELDTAQGAARQAADRDRRQLRSLREGLAEVRLRRGVLWAAGLRAAIAGSSLGGLG